MGSDSSYPNAITFSFSFNFFLWHFWGKPLLGGRVKSCYKSKEEKKVSFKSVLRAFLVQMRLPRKTRGFCEKNEGIMTLLSVLVSGENGIGMTQNVWLHAAEIRFRGTTCPMTARCSAAFWLSQ